MKNSTYIHQHALSNVQLEPIKLYSTNLNEHELLELKSILVHHFSQKAINEADNIWQEKGMSVQTMDDWLNAE
ncbi:hypothetical protein VU05_02250 [Desulfobulbus sp. F1]|nr:hypothetical protein [Desulfobulbus sp. F1]